jgi:hypothetical protein
MLETVVIGSVIKAGVLTLASPDPVTIALAATLLGKSKKTANSNTRGDAEARMWLCVAWCIHPLQVPGRRFM